MWRQIRLHMPDVKRLWWVPPDLRLARTFASTGAQALPETDARFGGDVSGCFQFALLHQPSRDGRTEIIPGFRPVPASR